jgi:hypothetical protein
MRCRRSLAKTCRICVDGLGFTLLNIAQGWLADGLFFLLHIDVHVSDRIVSDLCTSHAGVKLRRIRLNAKVGSGAIRDEAQPHFGERAWNARV